MHSLQSRAHVGASAGAIALAAVALSLAACTPPPSQYRYTALVPAARALAWDGRTAADGTLRLEGTMSTSTLVRNENPQLHDTAVHVPNVTIEGVAILALVPGVELGLRYNYSQYAWSDVSAEGTLPLPSRPSIFGLGPEMRVTIPFDRRKRWALGIAGNFMHYDIPYAEWVLTMGCAPGVLTCVTDRLSGAQYRLNDERSETHYTMNIAVYPSVELGRRDELGHIFGGFSAHTGFKNDGFTNTVSNGSTIEDAGLVFAIGAGYGIKIDMLRLSGMLALPMTTSSAPVNYGLGGFLTAGVDLELWESREEKRRERELRMTHGHPRPSRDEEGDE